MSLRMVPVFTAAVFAALVSSYGCGYNNGKNATLRALLAASVSILDAARVADSAVLTRREEENHEARKIFAEKAARLERAKCVNTVVRDWAVQPVPDDVLRLLQSDSFGEPPAGSAVRSAVGNPGT